MEQVYYNKRLILNAIPYEKITVEHYNRLCYKHPHYDFICDGDNQVIMILDNGKEMILD